MIRERLVELHLPLVRALARRHAHRAELHEDLVQVGSIGLIDAIERFDLERGEDLVTFAVPTINGEIRHYLRDRAALVRVPRRLGDLSSRLRASRESLTAHLFRSPTVPELAHEAGVAETDVVEAMASEQVRSPASLSPPAEGGEELDVPAVLDDSVEASDDRLLLAAGFRALASRERRILHLRYYADLSQAEIADEMGLSQVQVSRLIASSLERMRASLEVGSRPSGGE